MKKCLLILAILVPAQAAAMRSPVRKAFLSLAHGCGNCSLQCAKNLCPKCPYPYINGLIQDNKKLKIEFKNTVMTLNDYIQQLNTKHDLDVKPQPNINLNINATTQKCPPTCCMQLEEQNRALEQTLEALQQNLTSIFVALWLKSAKKNKESKSEL